jgi:hypothetical protein
LGNAYEFVATIHIIDGSKLFVRDYLFINGKRKYSYHWQDDSEKLILRWDNADHHRRLSTFPFHQHSGSGIEESVPLNLEKVLQFISKRVLG